MKRLGKSNQESLAWYQEAMGVLTPLRWHLNDLVEAMEAHNRYARRVGEPLLPETKIEAARAAGRKADEHFGAVTVEPKDPE